MKKYIIFALLLFCISMPVSAASLIYPFEKISKPSCRFSPWSAHSEDCKISLPVISQANYGTKVTDQTFRRIYSVLWQGTYTYGWDYGSGSHLGVDIATAAGTPVRAIADGEVIQAQGLSGWGNTVTIRHTLPSGRVIYSNYAHLGAISVSRGPIRQGDILGEVGSTGNSYGNHLHFQIDTSDQSHPYYYISCGKGKNPMDIVDQGLCQSFLRSNTVDPIALIELGESVITTPIAISNPATLLTLPIPTQPAITGSTLPITPVPVIRIKTRDQILAEEAQEFLAQNVLTLDFGVTSVPVGADIKGRILLTKNGNPFIGNLPQDIRFELSNSSASVFPQSIATMERFGREFVIAGKTSGSVTLRLFLGTKLIKERQITVYRAQDLEYPKSARIQLPLRSIIADEKLGVVHFTTPSGVTQKGIPYRGVYRLEVTSGNAVICNVSRDPGVSCRDIGAKRFQFGYTDTLSGSLAFKIVPLGTSQIQLSVVDIKTGKIVAGASRTTRLGPPKDFNILSVYSGATAQAIAAGYLSVDRGYVLPMRDITFSEAKMMAKYFLLDKQSVAKTIRARRTYTQALLRLESAFPTSRQFDRMTRGAFASALLSLVPVEKGAALSTPFIDEVGAHAASIAVFRSRGFIWRDAFAQRYFQGDKNITREEAAYLLLEFARWM